jgi:hypothetical protein
MTPRGPSQFGKCSRIIVALICALVLALIVVGVWGTVSDAPSVERTTPVPGQVQHQPR